MVLPWYMSKNKTKIKHGCAMLLSSIYALWHQMYVKRINTSVTRCIQGQMMLQYC